MRQTTVCPIAARQAPQQGQIVVRIMPDTSRLIPHNATMTVLIVNATRETFAYSSSQEQQLLPRRRRTARSAAENGKRLCTFDFSDITLTAAMATHNAAENTTLQIRAAASLLVEAKASRQQCRKAVRSGTENVNCSRISHPGSSHPYSNGSSQRGGECQTADTCRRLDCQTALRWH